jgi:hypothetical protein
LSCVVVLYTEEREYTLSAARKLRWSQAKELGEKAAPPPPHPAPREGERRGR